MRVHNALARSGVSVNFGRILDYRNKQKEAVYQGKLSSPFHYFYSMPQSSCPQFVQPLTYDVPVFTKEGRKHSRTNSFGKYGTQAESKRQLCLERNRQAGNTVGVVSMQSVKTQTIQRRGVGNAKRFSSKS